MKTWLHGEVVFRKVKMNMPRGKKVELYKGNYRVADSETTGNHHLVEYFDGLEMVEKDGKFYIKPDRDITVKCVDITRHDTYQIPKCTEGEVIEIFRKKEYDHINQEVINVRD